MKKFFSATAVFLLISSCQLAYGQENKTEKIRVFTDKADKKKSTPSHVTIVKINPLLYINGEIPVFVERYFGNIGKSDFGFGLEAGLGVTGHDYIKFSSDLLPIEYPASFVDKYANSTYKAGITFRGAAKLYFDSDFPEGMYIGAEVRLKNYNLSYTATDNTLAPGPYTLHDNFFDVVGLYGKQFEITDNLIFESYSGIGIRTMHLDYINKIAGLSGFTAEKATFTTKSVIYAVGFKIGYCF